MATRTVVAAFACTLAFGSHALAQGELAIQDVGKHTRKNTIDAFALVGVFTDYRHFGGGAIAGIPVVHDGFIDPLNDALYLELGASLAYFQWENPACDAQWFAATPFAGARWSFFLTDQWTTYAAGRGGYRMGFGGDVSCGDAEIVDPDYSALAFDVGLGAHWQMSREWALRFEIGMWPLVGMGTTF